MGKELNKRINTETAIIRNEAEIQQVLRAIL